MTRRKFIALLSAAAAACAVPLTFIRRYDAPCRYPVPQSALTAAMIRKAWELYRPGQRCHAIVTTDELAMKQLVYPHAGTMDLDGIFLRWDHTPRRFDVVQGQRIEILPDGSPPWFYQNAPFQDHVLLDGDVPLCIISVRRMIPADAWDLV